MDLVTGWTGRAACALQAALRMSNEAFAEHLGIGVRAVAAWHQKPGLRPRPEMQQVLDTALARAPAAAGERFAVLTGEPARAVSARTDDDGAAAEAEHRLIADQNISRALSRLDQLAAWEPGTARRKVAARLAGLDTPDLLDRASRRSRVGRDDVADALGEYYRCQAGEHGQYIARCGHDGGEIVTSVLTCPDWLDLGCPLTAGHDRPAAQEGAPSPSRSQARPSPRPSMPPPRTTPPASTPAAPAPCGMPARPSRRPRRCSPSPAVSSSLRDFAHLTTAGGHPKTSTSSAWPGRTQRHNPETRVTMTAEEFVAVIRPVAPSPLTRLRSRS